MSFRSECAYLGFYKQSLNGRVRDYIVSFNENQTEILDLLEMTWELFEQLVQSFPPHKLLRARLVAKVNFIHVNSVTNEMEQRCYHFASYKTELVIDPDDFYKRHMTKIASRLDEFNRSGSNLMIKNIEHIHILFSI